jgi:hypothetical protein
MPIPLSSISSKRSTTPPGRARAGAQRHAAFLGELDPIGEKIGENLAEAQRVADHRADGAQPILQIEPEVLLLGPRLQQSVQILDQLPQVEGLRIELQLAGLDLGKVEDLVKQGEQGLARAQDRLDPPMMPRGQVVGAEQQLGHAEHAVHRGPDLVAHGGEEGGFGRARRQRLLPLEPQLELVDHQARKLLQPAALGLGEAGTGLEVGDAERADPTAARRDQRRAGIEAHMRSGAHHRMIPC